MRGSNTMINNPEPTRNGSGTSVLRPSSPSVTKLAVTGQLLVAAREAADLPALAQIP
jgi:hypothetical protein